MGATSNSYLNIVFFLLTTFFYYQALKPTLTLATYQNKDQYLKYVSHNYMYLAIYVLLVIMIQFMVNAQAMTASCGGSLGNNLGPAGVITFLPWILIFGVLVLVLTVYPGFKTAFSDVVGYYYVHNSANQLLTELLMNKEMEAKMHNDPSMTAEKRLSLESAADVILKICGNASLLINQIVPSNFEQYWSLLSPLMKDKYQNSQNHETQQMKQDLFQLVVSRDVVGEAMWYIYTGLLLTSIVQLKITTYGCSNNPKTMQANYQKFLEQEQEAETNKQNVTTTYNVSG